MRLLILGGTTEASALAAAVARRPDIAPILSLAGRTENPRPAPIPSRIGGFGGIDGLATYLGEQRIDAIVDATHPFAGRISAHAIEAAARIGVPLAVFTRPPWSPGAGDDWNRVPDLDAAALALGPAPATVLLTSGRLGLAAFRAAPQHRYIVRSIDPPARQDCPPRCEIVLARPPFDVADETALLRRHGIEILVTKNSGGEAGAAKLRAARALRLPVVMVERPDPGAGATCFIEIGAVLDWIDGHGRTPAP